MASMIPIASQEKFDSISPVRSNGLAINLELQLRGGGGSVGDDGDPLRRPKPAAESCADSLAPSSDGGGGDSGAGADEEELPAEWPKTALCVAALLLVCAGNLLSVAAASQRIPATKQDANQTHPPLRDITYDLAQAAPQLQRHQLLLLVAAEVSAVATSAYVLVAVVLLHRHRSIVLRRYCFLAALLFGLRLLTMNVTMLPVSNGSLYRCQASERGLALGLIGAQFVDLLRHVGLSVDGEVRYCGNYVFNGHAVILVLNCLWMDEYGVAGRLVAALAKVVAAASLLSLVVAGYDYTISIIVAYYATTRIFWIYHTLANNASLRRYDPVNQVCKEWWYPIFRYLEGNVRNVVPSSRKFQ